MKSGTFDGLTKALASPASRRSVFRRFAGVLLGGTVGGAALATLSPNVAFASSNHDCVYFCESVFPAGSNRTQCTSDAANGTGLCYSLGPRSTGGSKSICCLSDSNGQCTSSSVTSCSSSQTCHHGTCVSTCSGGTTLLNGTCAQSCSGSCSCGFCVTDLVLNSYCTNAQGSLTLCVTDLTCPKGEFCNNILGVGVCQTAVSC
jgi:hypothetical protein